MNSSRFATSNIQNSWDYLTKMAQKEGVLIAQAIIGEYSSKGKKPSSFIDEWMQIDSHKISLLCNLKPFKPNPSCDHAMFNESLLRNPKMKVNINSCDDY